MVFPAQMGELLLAVAIGKAFTMTEVVAEAVQPLPSVTVTWYVPLAEVVAEGIFGFCIVELNEFTLVQA